MTNRRYQMELWAWLLVYAVLLFGAIKLLDGGAIVAIPVRIVVGLSPMIGGFGILQLMMRRYRSLDELQQKIMAEGILFAFGATAILTFGYGFLQRSINAPDLSWFWVWPVLASSWGLGTAFAWRRYR